MRKCNDQISLKLAGELRATLEDEAAAHGRSLSNLIRQVLKQWAADRVVERTADNSVGRAA
jgi:hypothetical protein